MTIRPSTALRNEYAEISRQCHETGEPIFITKNGEGDVVVMSIEAFEQHETEITLRLKLMEASAELASGIKPLTEEEAEAEWKEWSRAAHEN